MYDEENWQAFRAEVLEFIKNKDETLIKKWLEGIGYKGTVGYYRNSATKTMEIYSTRPGILIGKAGCHVAQLREMLTSEFYGEWNVKFIEVRGGFVNI